MISFSPNTYIVTKKIIETICYRCNGITHQQPLFIKQVATDDYKNNYMAFMIIECGGCKGISFIIREPLYNKLPDEDQFIDFNYPSENEITYMSYNFLRLEDQDKLPKKLFQLYEEIKFAFKSDLPILAAIGLRMLVEATCSDQKIPGKNLQDKITRLHEQGLISKNELPLLHKLRLMGNNSAHNLKSLSVDKISYALDSINHILRSIYVLPKINRLLKL